MKINEKSATTRELGGMRMASGRGLGGPSLLVTADFNNI
jgi:hypothetical protein